MGIKFLDLHSQYIGIKDEIDEAIQSVIRDSAFIGGKYVQGFESNFAKYLNVRDCIGVANGTDALEIAIEALKLGSGSEIIVPANSFIATSEAITRNGHKVVFCDCDPGTYTISIKDAEKRITSNTRAIIPVHLYGRPCDMASVMELAKRFNLRVIEDCAQAHGAEINQGRVGAFGDIGTFSFYPGKNLGAYGDAGAIVTNDAALADLCRKIANHGRIGKYDHEFEGRNSRMDGLQAAILSVKLRYLDAWIYRRIEVANVYFHELECCSDLILPDQATAGMRHVYHLFVIRTLKRDQLKRYLNEHGIETGIHYPTALPKLPAYAYCMQYGEDMTANRIDGELLSLPMGEHLTISDAQYVSSVVRDFFDSN